MNDAPRGVRPHIVILGKCNVGKSTLINALCGQEIALVSAQAGTTTDPVYKSMELLPYGPVVFVDTAGLDDLSELGQERVKLTERALRKADLALLVVEQPELDGVEQAMLGKLAKLEVPSLVVVNTRETDFSSLLRGDKVKLSNTNCAQSSHRTKKSGSLISSDSVDSLKPLDSLGAVDSHQTLKDLASCAIVNARLALGIRELREQMASLLVRTYDEQPLVRDLLHGDDPVILVTPIDSAAPKGRLILPQVQMLRDILDGGFTALVCRETELETALKQLGRKPQMVITDSQVFKYVAEVLPADIPLSSFSILMARYKGDLPQLLAGVEAIEQLRPGDAVLIAEACTHHSQEDDIGRVKIPRLLQARVGGALNFTWCSGQDFPRNLSDYKIIIHCGACMINRKEMLARLSDAQSSGIPIVNYGLLLAHLNGILERSVRVVQL